MGRAAVFVDRDGTLIEDVNYLSSADQIRIMPGAVPGLRRLHDAGYLIVILTNQSAVARGIITEAELGEIHRQLVKQVEMLGGQIDAVLYCPHHPEGTVAAYAVTCDCRKPQPGLFLLAREAMDIDFSQSFGIGDAWRDVAAGLAVGVPTVKLPRPAGQKEPDESAAEPLAEARTIAEAAEIILATTPEKARAKVEQARAKLAGERAAPQEPVEVAAADPATAAASDSAAVAANDQTAVAVTESTAAAASASVAATNESVVAAKAESSPGIAQQELFAGDFPKAEMLESAAVEPAAVRGTEPPAATPVAASPVVPPSAGKSSRNGRKSRPSAAPPAPAGSTQEGSPMAQSRLGNQVPVGHAAVAAASKAAELAADKPAEPAARDAVAGASSAAPGSAAVAGAAVAPAAASAAPHGNDEVLRDLLVELRRQWRRDNDDSFDMPLMLAYVFQVLALVLGAVMPVIRISMSSGHPLDELPIWLLAAIFVQLVALTMFIVARRR